MPLECAVNVAKPSLRRIVMRSRTRIAAFCAGASFVLCGAAEAAAPAYPARPIRLLVPFAAGGGSDTLARILSARMSEAMGQTWVVDNRGGAGGNLAAETAARAEPDGHTVFIALSTVLTVNPSLYKLSFSVERDLQPAVMLAGAQYILVVHPSVPAATVAELVTLAKQKPGTLNYASGGTGTPLHLAAELLKTRAGIAMTHVAYKGGGPAAASVLAGETQVLFGSVASSLPHIKAGRLRALATTGSKRAKVAPELPTIAESGYPGFDVSTWYALLVPARTPAFVVERLYREALQALQHPEVQKAMAAQGLEIEPGSGKEVAARIKSETAMWAGVIKDAGIKAQ
jgi:tripartite-type tricarboxylate transporter receptor subunit TctC